MRKTLIAAIVASALFAVGAFAAELTINADDVASGEATVSSCASKADLIAWDTTDTVTPASDANTDWQVEGATVELTEDEGRNCDGAVVDIAIGSDTNDDGTTDSWSNGSCTTPASGLTYTCTIDPTVDVRPVVEVAVLVNGNSLPVPVSPSL